MMLRRAIAVAALLAAPALASAQASLDPRQTGPQLPYARWAVTPFIGFRAPLTTGQENLFIGGETVSTHAITRERGGAFMAGIEGEARFARQWSVVGSFASSARGTETVTRISGTSADSLAFHGDRFTFAKLGFSYRIPDPAVDSRRFHPGGFVVVAPALVHIDRPGFGGVTSPAVNLGIAATAPVGRSRNLAFQIGLDDYATWWNTDKLEEQDGGQYTSEMGKVVVVDYAYSMSNVFAVRLGASFRF
jgi:hypothetical protein